MPRSTSRHVSPPPSPHHYRHRPDSSLGMTAEGHFSDRKGRRRARASHYILEGGGARHMRAASRLPDQCFSLRHSGGHYCRPVTAVMGPQGALGSLTLPGAKLALPALPHDPHAHPPPTTTSENCMWRAWRTPHSLGVLACYIMEALPGASFIPGQRRRPTQIASLLYPREEVAFVEQ
ncbi:hypothetical protein E2C01_001518 [Portunus trituberculatus]|uniref:Uncharacterized protein n=1 Tax=Portunus trituberculatus TaxID=210409 RepID=A0A5B7CJH1_PORTR|nr:hypothetical protein [Portunus trituberculatus]